MPLSRQDGYTLLCHMLSVCGQTMYFGVLLFTFPVSVYILIQRISQTSSKVLLAMLSLMFALSSAFWAAALVDLVVNVLNVMKSASQLNGPVNLPIYNALILINFVIADGVVVWRAWAISREKRIALYICAVFLAITSLTTLIVIAIRMIIQTPLNGPLLSTIIDVAQVVNLGFSLFTNLIATVIISVKAWKFRAELYSYDAAQKQSAVQRALFLLIESGMIYILSGIFAFVSTMIRLPHGTMGDIYQPVHAQLSSVYPTAVLILVKQQKSLEDGVAATGAQYGPARSLGRRQLPTIQFRGRTTTLLSSNTRASHTSYRDGNLPAQLRPKTDDAGERRAS